MCNLCLNFQRNVRKVFVSKFVTPKVFALNQLVFVQFASSLAHARGFVVAICNVCLWSKKSAAFAETGKCTIAIATITICLCGQGFSDVL